MYKELTCFVYSYPGYATDATVALLLGMLFFIIPASKPTIDRFGKYFLNKIIFKTFSNIMIVKII